jgi:WhiB family transcriptional regulator, redox-sensing transcriptional regulator
MTALDNRAELWSRAACSTSDPEIFFPISSCGPAAVQVARAKAICAGCEIRRECLEYAIVAGPIQGIWGGLTEHERRLFRQRGHRTRVFAQGRATRRPLARQAVT